MINVEGIIQYLSFMSNNLIIMSKARTILKMYTEGVSKQAISLRTGATRNAVKKYCPDFIKLKNPADHFDLAGFIILPINLIPFKFRFSALMEILSDIFIQSNIYSIAYY